jgi:outer membrane receptor protein involved in Fe transport
MNRLSLAVQIGLAAGIVAATGLAQAQQAPPAPQDQAASKSQPKTLQTVVVTGSLIRRVDVETASPVTTVDRQNITSSGKPTLGDVLQQLPSIAGNATNPQSNTNGGGVASPLTEGGDGASRVSLRGLDTGRTLVLIDGQRMLNADLNLVPQNMVRQIDVLAEGASTTYGSDAVGGVVNILLRHDFNGAEVSVDSGISGHGDGQRHGLSITMGHSGDRYNIVGGINYNKYNAVPATRRDFSKEQLYLYGGVVTAFGSSSIPNGRMSIPDSFAQYGCTPNAGLITVTRDSGAGTALGDYRCRTSSDTFNYAAYNYIQTSQQRTNGFLIGSYNLTDNITAFVDAFYNHTTSAGQDASIPVGSGDGLVIPATAPFNPFGVTFSNLPIPGDPNSGYVFQTRLTGVGTRIHPYTTSTGQLITGLRGTIGQSSWNWNATVDYGHTVRTQVDHNELYIPALQAAIDAGANIFDQQANSAALAAGTVNAKYRKNEILRQVSVGANGDLFSLPAGDVQLAVGALYRKQSMNYTINPLALLDPATGTCQISQEACGSPGSGKDNVKEACAETLIPLLKDMPGAYALNLDVGVRYSDFDSAGSTTNGKIAIEWRPIQDLLVRGTISQVFRAPNLDDLYDGRSIVQPTLNDPCAHLSAAELLQHPLACQNVPPDWAGNSPAQVNTYYSGANTMGIKLKPEHGKSVDFGFVYNPSWAPGLNTSLDFWHIYLYDTLVPISGITVVNACFNNEASPFCSFIHRFGGTTQPGQVFSIDTPVLNLGTLSTSGIDFTVNYKLPHFDIGGVNPGDFKLGLATSYIATFNNNTTPGNPGSTVDKLAGTWNAQFGNVSRWRGTATIGWNRGNWDAQWRTRYISPVTALNADYLTPGVSLPVASVVYSALQLGYAVPAIHTRFDVGVDNVFDKQPPLIYQNGQVNTDISTYDTMGRYYWARATLKF